jgi:uncharacterized protein (DUF697 family)
MSKNTTPETEIPPTETATPEPQPAPLPARSEQALTLVRSYLPWSAGAGAIPLPGIDLTALLAVQLRMLAKLAELYEIPFRKEAAKSIAGSLLGTALPGSVAGGIASTFKAIPILGTLVGIAILPALGAAATYAVGKVFITHFESGGTFLDLDPASVQAHFRSEFTKAQEGAAKKSA